MCGKAVKECKGKRGNLAQALNLFKSTYYYSEKSEAG
jgi:hypothetical protein